MKQFIVGSVLGLGTGAVVGAGTVAYNLLKHDAVADTVAKVYSDKIVDWLFKSAAKSAREDTVYSNAEEVLVDHFSRPSVGSLSLDDLVLHDRNDAFEAINRLHTIIEAYEFASVTDLADVLGVSAHFGDRHWGWNNLETATYIKVENGWRLDLPRPIHAINLTK